MNLIIFLIVIVISFVVIKIGALAFELTGVQKSVASFQSLSCFTGTGFTTRESELITRSVQRRRIASFLIILGNAGFVTLIATAANTMRTSWTESLSLPFSWSFLPHHARPFANLIFGIFFVYISYKLFTSSPSVQKIKNALRNQLLKRELGRPVTYEEFAHWTGGYGIVQVRVGENSPLLGRRLRQSNLRSYDITVLAIEKQGGIITNPHADIEMGLDDKLLCFGKPGDIKNRFGIVGLNTE